jgi:hypothetical protein
MPLRVSFPSSAGHPNLESLQQVHAEMRQREERESQQVERGSPADQGL